MQQRPSRKKILKRMERQEGKAVQGRSKYDGTFPAGTKYSNRWGVRIAVLMGNRILPRQHRHGKITGSSFQGRWNRKGSKKWLYIKNRHRETRSEFINPKEALLTARTCL